MTTPLWCLLGFVAWTLVLVATIAGSRVAAVVSGRNRPGDFPSGIPHGGDRYWRLNRAHLNCLENLPLFGAVVFVATITGAKAPILDTLARVYLTARVGQSITHVASGSPPAINVRFAFFLAQYACLVGFLVVLARG